VKAVLEHTDIVLLDIKHINNEQHKLITGKSNDKTLAFIEYLNKINKPVWLRYVLVPGYSDDAAHLNELGQKVGSYSNIEKLEIQPYHELGAHKYEHLGWEYKLKDVSANTDEQLDTAYNIFKKYFKDVVIN
jgi:pyruvate formate lyase activating enzyme